jgi:riboflavin biosynthesis pyrimidine reductase
MILPVTIAQAEGDEMTTMIWDEINDAESCEQKIFEIYEADLKRSKGIIHVTSVWSESSRSMITLRIGPETPRSTTDSFVLNVARARADAIVTTGKTLREERAVTHDLEGPGCVPEALAEWRVERLGKPEPPLSVVLTSGRDVDLDHPLFRSGTIPMIATSREGARELADRAGSKGIEVVERETPSLRDVISYLVEVRGLETVVIEAGPSTSRALYEPPIAVNELMLSVFMERRLPRSVKGGSFFSLPQLGLVFPMAASAYKSKEESGLWIFRRYTRE